jgi:hypothetical protein
MQMCHLSSGRTCLTSYSQTLSLSTKELLHTFHSVRQRKAFLPWWHSVYTSVDRWHHICGSAPNVSNHTPIMQVEIILNHAPLVCPRLAIQAESVLKWSLKVLLELQDAWPMAIRWHKALRKTLMGLSSLNTDELPTKTSEQVGFNNTVSKLLCILCQAHINEVETVFDH